MFRRSGKVHIHICMLKMKLFTYFESNWFVCVHFQEFLDFHVKTCGKLSFFCLENTTTTVASNKIRFVQFFPSFFSYLPLLRSSMFFRGNFDKSQTQSISFEMLMLFTFNSIYNICCIFKANLSGFAKSLNRMWNVKASQHHKYTQWLSDI